MKIRLVDSGVFTPVEDIEMTLTAPASGFYWLDADVDDLAELQPLFSLHDLAVEDCLSEEEQRPKIEIYENHYFIVVNSIRFDDEEIFLRALNVFLGRHFIITVTKQKIHELRSVKPLLWEDEVSTPDRFLYLLIDLVTDNYFSVGDRIEARIEKLEEDILMHTKKSHLSEIIGLRSEILWLKKVLGPQKEVINTLNKKDLRLIDDQLQKYFSDIYENAVKISETFETYRDLMGNLREAYQSSIANRANEIMRVFTAITTIFIPLTLITGIYGMNFDYMPELHWKYSYYVVIGIMVFAGALMFYLFRKKDWI
ncbi:magnesium and cobalt transport protein CorA [Paenibacillus vortex V453]|jgi:magnesium transporter|uniref:Magnesium transport protein CorA n=2 Tax=Paenibacillus TaxID=44249 RepID=A0A163FLP9_9BACL|nr:MULTISPECIES: magnesium/cobalt transporter CorA [Paenibacillus]ANA79061.1 magnesium transporter [Paenibacillus glucanolyticus]AVV57023.1 magnesium and cobalt transport protein CorA [Paenibacillus glucanolyticus]AWP26165.1 magnesium and cobalt transport protein CorA [Paenibacillus sp. Cedars]EFU39029.1 magnesium and cobalt transport protein CorA [Paenibacillus vortex V453]ETT39205.1 magnesium and cobalt transport protein CorA [Paenibacillus sp. FSL R5-808]